MQLFSQQHIALPLTPSLDGELMFWPDWMAADQADACLASAITSIPWQSDSITIAGKSIPIPRLHRWYSEPAARYEWSGIQMTANPFPHWLDQLRLQVQRQTGYEFNSALANYYRSGMDSVDWHADDEAILGAAPVVASISLGVERQFQLRHRDTRARFDLNLPHGSLLMMGPGIQQYWQHRIPKVKNLEESRVNFTFRLIQNRNISP